MQTWVITGASRGIGLEMARQLHARGERVIAVCRSATRDLTQIGVELVEGIDVGTDAAMEALEGALRDTRIDVLVNNAGVLTRETLADLDTTRMLRQYQINALGPLRVTRALLGSLGPGSKVAIVSSRVGSIADNASGGNYGYRMSKAAVNMGGANLAIELRDREIAVALLHPGLVATDMTGHTGIPPSEAASGLIARIDELGMATSGGFWHANGERLPW